MREREEKQMFKSQVIIKREKHWNDSTVNIDEIIQKKLEKCASSGSLTILQPVIRTQFCMLACCSFRFVK